SAMKSVPALTTVGPVKTLEPPSDEEALEPPSVKDPEPSLVRPPAPPPPTALVKMTTFVWVSIVAPPAAKTVSKLERSALLPGAYCKAPPLKVTVAAESAPRPRLFKAA